MFHAFYKNKSENTVVKHLKNNENHTLGDGWNEHRGIIKVENKLFSYSGVINIRQTAIKY